MTHNGTMFGPPGGRETRQFNIETEVRIALQQWKWATIAALVLAALIQIFVVKSIGRLLRTASNGAAITRVENIAAYVLLFLALVLPALATFTNFMVNLYDSNHPAPKQALPADYGPIAPWWLRAMTGWRTPKYTPIPTESYNEAPDTPIEDRLINFKGYIPDDANKPGSKNTHYDARLPMSIHDCRKLQNMALNKKPFSVREMHKAGFSWERARELNKLMMENGAIFQPDKKHTVVRESFRRWLMSGDFYGDDGEKSVRA